MPKDDAATANWGSGWRMPTHKEWAELYQNIPNTWTTRNGVKGRLFTASNGNSLFLPTAGYRWADELSGVDCYGNYWSSSLNTDYPGGAWYLDFRSYGAYVNDYSCRLDGFSVRPVRAN